MAADFVQLDRTFHELALNDGDDNEIDYRNVHYGKRLSWQDLIQGFRTVVLSEAGSGKTEEIRNAARSLRAEGKAAFFLRLEHAANHFDVAFEEGSLPEFEQWLVSSEEGWLFLDSVDESRLRDPMDFERAIRRIGAAISAALQRIHIVISGRGSAWRPITDLALCAQQLRYQPPRRPDDAEPDSSATTEKASGPFRVLALDDLNPLQVETFAKAKGIADPTPFTEAIERADAWAMAARPDDLSELVEFWKTNTRIGNRLELMRASIARRLAERDQNRQEVSPLTLREARLGAQAVAAAATMAQESTIRVPDGTANASGLAIGDILPAWQARKCQALLSLPIFDEAIYQTVRFHHRTVREFLTAEWFLDLLQKQTSRRNIERVFFRKQYGIDVIVPAMRPVLVWLILWDEKIRERALSISPELIFEGGEPKALPLHIRQQILRSVCEKMHTGIVRGQTTDYRAVQRFADADIAADVKELLAEYGANDDLQTFLLRMVWQGELIVALPESKGIALNPESGRYARIAAFRAVRAIGSNADMQEVRERFLGEAKTLDRDLFAELIEGLPPLQASIDWLLACFAKLTPKERFSVDRIRQPLDAFFDKLSPELIAELLAGIHGLLQRRPVVERRYCEISKRHGWLIKSATIAAERLIVLRHPAALLLPTLSILQKLPSAQHYREWDLREIGSDIVRLVPAWPELNHAVFWHSVKEARRRRDKKTGERLTKFWQARLFDAYWRFETKDFEQALVDITNRKLNDDKLVALSLAFSLYVQAKRPKKMLRQLKKAVADNRLLTVALHEDLHPLPRSAEERKWRNSEAKYRRRRKLQEATESRKMSQWQQRLSENVEGLRSPQMANPCDVSGDQYHLHQRMRSSDGIGGFWTSGNWSSLEADFGPDVARAFRDGVVAYWRKNVPKLRSEGKAQSSTPFSVIFGLCGLAIEASETENWPSTLNEDEAALAFRYAMDELNGFPDWFPGLFAAFPEVLSRLLLVEIDRDLRIETAKSESHYVLADLSWSGSWAWECIGQGVFERLKAREPKNISNLGYLLNIVHGSNVDRLELARLAELRSADRRLDHAACWFAVWAGTQPERAIPELEKRLTATKGQGSQTKLAMKFVTHLLGGRRDYTKLGDAFRSPAHLTKLYALMHRFIREKEDIQRAGKGVYSPGLRDDAQDARNRLFGLLKEIPGKESFLGLMELAELHPEPSSRPWMEHHAKTKAELDADLTPWSVEQTLDFQTKLERTPANHRELFELCELHMLDLKDDLENGDSSIVGILLKGATLETDMRKYIGNWCRERAAGRYSIPQEEELADAKRPDFRAHGSAFDAPVPIELKLADNWSGPDLLERLENQLCGDYLRDTRSSRGLFVLVYRGDKTTWQLPGKKSGVSFTELVEALRSHWLAISARFPKVDDIRVIGIDLTLRSSSKGT